MPVMSIASTWIRRWGPELALALLAAVIFLGFLGSVELWGKREQRASAEAIDTIENDHWLVARIQGRLRLEKPPLPRWTIAGLMLATGRRDEAIARLPGALSALATVALVFGLGRRIGGRSVGLASGLALISMGYFVAEMRQAGNDGPLVCFTTLALYAAWRRLNPDDAAEVGPRRWNFVMYGALGLGFLTKGPVVVLLVALTVLPYLACVRRFRNGVIQLTDGWGVALFLLLALSWPLPVLLNDPNAVKIWIVEMGQKTGASGIAHERWRAPLAVDWPWMIAPWCVFGSIALAWPFVRLGEADRPGVWFPWWWAVGNLSVFCLWSVAKPNYFLPCLPGAAILAGLAWVRLAQWARGEKSKNWASLILQLHWIALFATGLLLPLIAYRVSPERAVWALAFGLALAVAAISSAGAWRLGADAGALAPLATAVGFGVLIGYGAIAPRENALRSHRALAEEIERIVPRDARALMFYHDLDEGLWFYLRNHSLIAVPGTQAAYNDAFSALEDTTRKESAERQRLWRIRVEGRYRTLVDWVKSPERESSYVLIRQKEFALFDHMLSGLVIPVYEEKGLKRSNLVLVRVLDRPTNPTADIAAKPSPDSATR
jgi:4-amino-4-deoxy-L-arabinose transferase-like glycosyltransferase